MSLLPSVVAVLSLLWPAWLNGYPLVFSDTGTYLSQMVERHLGWDRPVFYSLFILPLHLTLTTWPVIIAQATLTVYVLRAALRALTGSSRYLAVVVPALSLLTALPWFTSELIPDFATGLLTIVLALLVVVPERFGRWERWALVVLAGGLIVVHLSNLLLTPLLLVGLVPLRGLLGARAPLRWRGLARTCLPWVAAVMALATVNLIGHDRFSTSPYGSVFALARSLDDGPAMAALRRHCPQAGWRLCIMAHDTRPVNSDLFLWNADSPLYEVGGPKQVAGEARAILLTALRDDPWAMVRAAVRDSVAQFFMAASGDGLQAWPDTVTPVIHRDFPAAEARRYDASRQTAGRLAVPDWLGLLHEATLAIGVPATLAGLALALRRRHPVAALCAATLLCLVGNAVITGALSGPHDRYQSRVAWLPVFAPLAVGLALRQGGAAVRLSSSRDPVPADGAAPSVS